MGNVFSAQRFFTIPVELVDSGALRDISSSAVRLYLALCYFGQKHTAVTLEVSNAELRDHAGLDPKSIKAARKQLQDWRLVDFEKGALGVYSYILRNPTSGERMSPPPDRKGVRRYDCTKKAHLPGTSQLTPSNLARPEFPKMGAESETAGLSSGFRCYACKGTEYWTRDRSPVCSRCHPDPRLPPTAKDLGF